MNLHAVTLQHVRDQPTNKLFDGDLNVKEHQEIMLNANIEVWEEAIKEFTFETFYITLSRDEAYSLMLVNVNKQLKDGTIVAEELNEYIPAGFDYNFCYEPILKQLEEKIQNKIDEIGATTGFFIKTSSRSPKDAPSACEKLLDLYRNRIKEKDDRSFDAKLDSLFWASCQCLKVFTAIDAINLLSSSDRIRTDMFVALSPDLAYRWNQNLVLRKWVDIEPDMEFRGFVHKNKFTALCQYNHQMLSRRLVRDKLKIQEIILAFWEENIKPRLAGQVDDYIVDFALTGDDFATCWVVELNPFLSSTSPNLFSWTKDIRVLCDGPFEFRIREKSSPGVLGGMVESWRDIIKNVEI